MRKIKKNLLAIFMCVLAVPCFAQESKEPTEHEKLAKVEMFGGYSYLHEEETNFNGWNFAVESNINKWLTLVADFDGHYATEEGASTHEHGFTFGPQFALRTHRHLVPFGFIFFGGAHRSVQLAGIRQSETGFAMNTGGGMDFEASKWFSIRLFQIDAAYTRFSGEGSTSPRLAIGLVFPIGHK